MVTIAPFPLILLILVGLTTPLAPLAQAQERESLGAVLRAIAEARSVSLLYTADLVEGRTTSCAEDRWRDASQGLDAVLACVLEDTGLEARRLPSGTVALYAVRTLPAASGPPPSVMLSGVIRDAATGEALIGATIYAPELRRGTTTNAYGFFSIALPSGVIRIVVSYIGYADRVETLNLTAGRRIDVMLEPEAGALGEVVVEADIVGRPETATQMSVDVVTGQDIREVPALLGEADVLRRLQLLPGIRGGSEASTGLHVRGGSPDQNLILLDGTPVYNASHLFGFLSVFNPDAVNRVEITRGGFPARYGGRLSSVVDIRLREGNVHRFGAQGAIGLLTSKILFEGPLPWNEGSFLLSGRRTYLDLALRPLLSGENETPTAYFYDLNAKTNWRVSSRDRVFLSLYGGGDRFGMTEQWQSGSGSNESAGHVGWGNLTGAFRWSRVFSGRLFGAATLVASDYEFNVDAAERERSGGGAWSSSEARYRSGIRDLGARVDFDFSAHPHHMVRFGGEVRRHRYETGAMTLRNSGVDVTLGTQPLRAIETSAYVEDEARLTDRVFANIGVHASAYSAGGKTFGSVQPRLAARLQLSERLALKASAVTMRQYVHLLTSSSGIGLPTDLWVPATPRVAPGESWQVATGLAGSSFRRTTTWTVEGYYKRMDGQVAYRDGASFATPGTDWQDLVVSGEGRSYGLEFGGERRTARTTISLGYTLSRTERRFDEVSEGQWFPYRYDRRHDLALSAVRRFSRRFDASATWIYGTGEAVTVPLATYPAQAGATYFSYLDEVPYYGDTRNAFRLPAYHRLDIDLSYYFRREPREHRLSLSAYNAYNRKNPYVVMLQERRASPQELHPSSGAVLRGYAIFPIVPSLSYSFQF